MSTPEANTPQPSHAGPGHSDEPGHEYEAHVHVMPMKILIAVFIALLFLTWSTVAISWAPLGQWSIVAALGIAVIKASLVVLFFMHLRYDAPFNGVILISALMFVTLFIGTTMLDATEYADNYQVPHIVETTQ